ncbi:hypothetical protein AKJ55_00710 [candidate division MSBL1 archaeon SCGC-AAA382M17]|uniref:Uncharacterized protein n=1 Tax=candidate division MSBL1 archaeon SCGC-AAA382M17 TaxID=1698284 RepID=A0ABR5TJR8_9EURY|nr:hypothetical protein AKJ55_00710 [candidate division MSBL1 archaeon SCGC-AAA382M17]
MVIGSPAFGLEALLLGLGGKISSAYRGTIKLITVAAMIGLSLVGISMVITHIFSLGPSSLCFLLLILTLISGKAIPSKQKKKPKGRAERNEANTTDDKIRSILKRRGLENLAEEKEEDSPKD